MCCQCGTAALFGTAALTNAVKTQTLATTCAPQPATLLRVVALLGTACIMTPASADELASESVQGIALRLSAALVDGSPLLELRPRYNVITETTKALSTDAMTLRTLVGWRSAPARDLRLTAQAILTGIVGPHRLNDDPRRSASSPYPLLPEPARQGVNEFHVEYRGFDTAKLRLGRQILKLDDERFISDVDFRQTPQLFDGLTISSQGLPGAEVIVGHYRRIRNVLGATSAVRLTVAHGAWNPAPGHSLIAYGYWHDSATTGAQTGFANNAQRIVGLRAEGEAPLFDGVRTNYLGEIAWQHAIGDGDARIAGRYFRVGAGIGSDTWTVRADHEEKGSRRGDYGFQTPLSDYYAFNGWALQFTTTPRAGIRDSWLTLRGALGPVEARAEHHRFRSAWGALDFGTEWDASLAYQLRPDTQARLQLARFRAGRDTPEHNTVNKTWLTVTYRY